MLLIMDEVKPPLTLNEALGVYMSMADEFGNAVQLFLKIIEERGEAPLANRTAMRFAANEFRRTTKNVIVLHELATRGN